MVFVLITEITIVIFVHFVMNFDAFKSLLNYVYYKNYNMKNIMFVVIFSLCI